MPDYVDGQDILSKRPEPGRLPKSEPVIIKEVIQEQPKIDTNAIIEAVIKGLADKMPKFVVGHNTNTVIADDFDNSASLDRLADAMSNSKNMESNVENLGKIKETKKDEKETKSTIDLLSNLED